MEAVKKLQNATKLLQKVTMGSGEGLGSARETLAWANVWIVGGSRAAQEERGWCSLLSLTPV